MGLGIGPSLFSAGFLDEVRNLRLTHSVAALWWYYTSGGAKYGTPPWIPGIQAVYIANLAQNMLPPTLQEPQESLDSKWQGSLPIPPEN